MIALLWSSAILLAAFNVFNGLKMMGVLRDERGWRFLPFGPFAEHTPYSGSAVFSLGIVCFIGLIPGFVRNVFGIVFVD